jgi:hypothetical protein
MPNHLCEDRRATAADSLILAADLAPILRTRLPSLLCQRTPRGLSVIADRMTDARLFDRLSVGSLEGLLEQC